MFSATITPHRSLGRTGFLLLMLAIGGVSFIAGIVFLIAGAWPVMGFFGLDVALIYWAFRANYRAARAYEQVTVTPSELTVRKVSQWGKAREWTLNPLWVRLDREIHQEFGLAASVSGLARTAACRLPAFSDRRKRKASPPPCSRLLARPNAGRRGRRL